jgi:hypothetical protein
MYYTQYAVLFFIDFCRYDEHQIIPHEEADIMTIETGKEFCFEKLISLRKRGTQTEINTAVRHLYDYLKANSLNKMGPTITVTFSKERKGAETVLDVEILIPVDRLFAPEYGYTFKSKFQLINAAHMCYKGKPEMLPATAARSSDIFRTKNFSIYRPYAAFLTEEPKTVGEVPGDMTVDLYIDLTHPFHSRE